MAAQVTFSHPERQENPAADQEEYDNRAVGAPQKLDIPIDYPLEGVLEGDAPSKCLLSLN